MKKILWISMLSVFSLLLAACGAQSTPEPLEMTIDMTEYAFAPADLEFQVGQEVTLNLVNKGALPHEIMFGRDVMMMDGRPNGYQVDMFEAANVEPEVTMMEAMGGEAEHTEGDEHQEEEHMEGDEHEEEEHGHSGFMVLVPVGDDTYTMKFTVTEDMVGEWEIGCFELEGVHYTSGMVGSLTVTE